MLRPLRRLVIKKFGRRVRVVGLPRTGPFLRPPTLVGGMIPPAIPTHHTGLYPTNSRSKRVHPVARGARNSSRLRLSPSRLVGGVRPDLRGNIRAMISRSLAKLLTMPVLVAIPTPNVGRIVPGLVGGWRGIGVFSIDCHSQLVPEGFDGIHHIHFKIVIGSFKPFLQFRQPSYV